MQAFVTARRALHCCSSRKLKLIMMDDGWSMVDCGLGMMDDEDEDEDEDSIEDVVRARAASVPTSTAASHSRST